MRQKIVHGQGFGAGQPVEERTRDPFTQWGEQGGQAPATVEPPAQPERHTDAAHEGAVKLMAADKSLTYSAALVESSRALRDGAMASVLNSMKGAV